MGESQVLHSKGEMQGRTIWILVHFGGMKTRRQINLRQRNCVRREPDEPARIHREIVLPGVQKKSLCSNVCQLLKIYTADKSFGATLFSSSISTLAKGIYLGSPTSRFF